MGKTTVGVISLGCDKNRVDSENLLKYLADGGFQITGDITASDVIVVNTCAFTKEAKEEAIDAVLEALEEKKKRGAKVVVTGCLPERYKDELAESLSEVDAFTGIYDYPHITEILNAADKGQVCRFSHYSPETAVDASDGSSSNRILTTPPHYAYLKIADGCYNRCTFCAIPYIRGAYRSTPIEALKKEAEFLIAEYGVKELILVAQDTTRYGIDLYGKPSLEKLLTALLETDIKLIRVLYLYPELMTNELISFMADETRIAKYADVPLQHISDNVLKRMGRRNNGSEAKAIVKALKDKGFAIRSSFIAGFPGETEDEFLELCEFIKEAKIDYAGFFAYSKEDGTPAEKLKPQIAAKDKKRRLKTLKDIQKSVMKDLCNKHVGSTLTVVYEGIDFDRNLFFGRSQYQAPDVDSQVLFSAEFVPEVGECYEVKINDTDGFNLIGEATALKK